ncbi:/ aspS / Aspartate--tRNA ligase /:484732 Reverse [Candidatus Hepatoplasma crinochetorum]|uniref:Aspartate--tRNA ligase n=1 Tax=Candidatus Hepatoplasma crinochetorum TaxID=295596 RepID=A0A0G7ZN04_9MOLU|nr:/ aspS / Aspartate--tRNA ligase /:484732 Reverse [Candidatus Hepatoplasma crinochetorum]
MNNNFNLTEKSIDKKVKLSGWVAKIRKLGDLIFLDLRNSEKIIQIVITNQNQKIYQIAKKLTKEDVILVKGIIKKRKNINKNLSTGSIELIASDLELISKAKILPFIIANQTDGLEALRMRYRYLDFRRENIYKIIKFRSNFNKIIRNYFDKLNFIEVETPTITKITFGGASEFKVLSKNHLGYEYGLAQSPQIYKQLLMYGGIDKYYQIAKCYRDEDLRKDRQLEFTQLDLEKAFTTKKEIKKIIEKLLFLLFKNLLDIELKIPFQRLKYQEAIDNFGTDKPDLRYEGQIYNFNPLKDQLKLNLEKNKSLFALISPKFINEKKIKDYFKKEEIKTNFYFFNFEKEKIVNSNLKNINQINILNFLNKQKLNILKEEQFSILIIENDDLIAKEIAGKLRIIIANENKLMKKEQFSFLWVENFPLFELLKDSKLSPMHNPFTAPKKSELNKFLKLEGKNKKELLKLNSEAYDIVLNGIEIGGGAMRITDPLIQTKVFKLLDLNEEEIKNDFSFLLEAQNYGVPNHGGIALGLDRLLAVMLKIDSIKEVIPFPKSSKGTDEMMGGPTKIKEEDLKNE